MASSAVEWGNIGPNASYREPEVITHGSNQERPFIAIIHCWLSDSGYVSLVGACPGDRGSSEGEGAIDSSQSIDV